LAVVVEELLLENLVKCRCSAHVWHHRIGSIATIFKGFNAQILLRFIRHQVFFLLRFIIHQVFILLDAVVLSTCPGAGAIVTEFFTFTPF
jgi:hypothetical protein